MNRTAKFLLITLALLLSACSKNDPGPIEGNWQMIGLVPMKIQFRSGETETMGIIEKVEYEVKGNDVIVSSLDGIAKGTAFRYTVVDKNTLQTEMGVLQRIK
jgi:hypothetical protein